MFGDSIYSDVTKVQPAARKTAKIVHDTPDRFARLRGMLKGMPLTRDKYVRLIVDGRVMMTDAEFERRTNLEVVGRAKGHALVAGLGIGLILDPLLDRCKSVTVVEINPDVIALVGPSYPKATIIRADIRKWLPKDGQKFDTIYFDIWGEFSRDDEEDAKSLARRFKPYLKSRGWMKSWLHYTLPAAGA